MGIATISMQVGNMTGTFFYNTENGRFVEIVLSFQLAPNYFFQQKMFFDLNGALFETDVFVGNVLIEKDLFVNGRFSEAHLYSSNSNGSIASVTKRTAQGQTTEIDSYAYISDLLNSILKMDATGRAIEIDIYVNGQIFQAIAVSINPIATAGSGYYYVSILPLFGSTGPVITDVNQGGIGDCYFEAALASLAYNNPSFIKSMIKDYGQGIYSVRFFNDGVVDWVTVDNQVGMYAANSPVSSWNAIVEKAYVSFRSEHLGGANNYDAINGGWDNGLRSLTGNTATYYYGFGGTSASKWIEYSKAVITALQVGEVVMYGSFQDTVGVNGLANLVSQHMLTVTGFNFATDKFILRNPWGTTNGAPNWNILFEESAMELYGTPGVNGNVGTTGGFIVNNSFGATSNVGQLTQALASLGGQSVATSSAWTGTPLVQPSVMAATSTPTLAVMH